MRDVEGDKENAGARPGIVVVDAAEHDFSYKVSSSDHHGVRNHHLESTTTAEPSLVGLTTDDNSLLFSGGPSIDFSLPGSTARQPGGDHEHAGATSSTGDHAAADAHAARPRSPDPLNRSLQSVDLDKKSLAYQRELLRRVHEERQVQNEKLLGEQQDKKAWELQKRREEEERRFEAQALAEGLAATRARAVSEIEKAVSSSSRSLKKDRAGAGSVRIGGVEVAEEALPRRPDATIANLTRSDEAFALASAPRTSMDPGQISGHQDVPMVARPPGARSHHHPAAVAEFDIRQDERSGQIWAKSSQDAALVLTSGEDQIRFAQQIEAQNLKQILSTPRTQKACREMGILPTELSIRQVSEFAQVGDPPSRTKMRFQHFEQKRQEKLKMVLAARARIVANEFESVGRGDNQKNSFALSMMEDMLDKEARRLEKKLRWGRDKGCSYGKTGREKGRAGGWETRRILGKNLIPVPYFRFSFQVLVTGERGMR